MQLTVNVNQAAALAAGIDAPNSTARLTIDPATLAPPVREWLAAHLRDGHQVTDISVSEPTVEALVAKVEAAIEYQAKTLAERAERLAIEEAREEEARVAWAEYSERLIAAPAECVKRGYSDRVVFVDPPTRRLSVYDRGNLTEPAQAVYDARVAEIEREREERAVMQKAAMLAAARELGGEGCAARFLAGYAPEDEIHGLVRAAELARAYGGAAALLVKYGEGHPRVEVAAARARLAQTASEEAWAAVAGARRAQSLAVDAAEAAEARINEEEPWE